MTPTNELRFVEREIDKQVGAGGRWYTEKHTVRILQQKWRDVPVVKEDA